MKRISALVIVLLTLLPLVISCGSGSESKTNAPDVTENTSVNEIAEETTDSRVRDELPSDLNLEGKTVKFLYRDEISSEFTSPELDGELVNDAIYNSHISVELRLNADIEPILRAGHYLEARQPYMDSIKNAVLANDALYDWVDLMIGNSSVMMREGIFMDIAKNEYVDLSKPWYLANMMNEVAINGKLYFISGDASLGYLKCTYCMYYNKKLAENFQIGSIYDVVNNGEWTIDKAMQISEMACIDLDGNGKYDVNDTLGFVVHDNNHPKGYITSSNTSLYEKDSDGVLHYIFGTERDAGICDKLYKLFHETKGFYYCDTSDAVKGKGYDEMTSKFVAGEILMITSEMDDINSRFRSMEDPYGVIPYPKYDEAQDAYYCCSRNTHNAFSMPLTCVDPGAAGAVMEALACENYNTLLPAYFETTMKVKYALDNETAQMFDLVKSSTVLTFWYTYNNAIGSPEGIFLECTVRAASAGKMASAVEKNRTRLETTLTKYIDEINALD